VTLGSVFFLAPRFSKTGTNVSCADGSEASVPVLEIQINFAGPKLIHVNMSRNKRHSRVRTGQR